MRCPYCKVDNDSVIDSRAGAAGDFIRRRRECNNCHRRYTTFERLEEAPVRVVKRNGMRVTFDRTKIMNGVLRACEKRPVPNEALEKLVDDVEEAATRKFDREVPSSFIGEEVMKRLARVDQVAYVRFASVYRQFKDAGDFAREIEKLSQAQG